MRPWVHALGFVVFMADDDEYFGSLPYKTQYWLCREDTLLALTVCLGCGIVRP